MPLVTGTRLGPYEIIAPIGSGGMGEVYRARDARLNRTVAIKLMPTVYAADADRLKRFEQEAYATAALNHPNVLVIYDVGTYEGQPFIVSELLEGETLRSKLENGAVPIRKAVDYAIQIVSGLAAAHARGIVHRDLKPANLFLTTGGRVKILDFGLAKLVDPAEVLGSASTIEPVASGLGVLVGTASYMSPEQVRGRTIDHRSDIFSFGLVLYEMLAGRRAFERASPVETMSAIIRDEPVGFAEFVSTLPHELELILRHCLEKDPEDRFQSARDLAFQLSALTSDVTSGVRKAASIQPPPARMRRAVLAVALALALGLALAAGFLGGRRAAGALTPVYQQLTFRRGFVISARFAPDGHTIVYGGAWDGKPIQLWSARLESPESRLLGLPNSDILAISSSGEMAISLGRRYVQGFAARGTLARLPLDGSAPRELLTDVEDADWSPDGSNLAVTHFVEGKYRLEFPMGAVLHETPGWINHVRISRDGTRVAFVDHPIYGDDRGSVCVVVRTGGGRQVLSDGWSSVTGLAWSADQNEIWFTAAKREATNLHAVDLSGRERTISSSGDGLTIQDVDPGGRVLLTESKFRLRIGAISPSAGTDKERDLSWLDGSVVTDLSADGRTMLINEQAAGGGTPLYAVFARKTDGSPAVKIGEGSLATLSPDGKWAAAVVPSAPPSIVLLPTGVGETRTLDRANLVDYQAVTWFPDGRRILLAGNETGRPVRLWVQDVWNGTPTPVSSEGLRIAFSSRPISPDGNRVAAIDQSDRIGLYKLDGGEDFEPIPGLAAGEVPIRWSMDGQSIYVFRKGELPAVVYRFYLADRRREVVASLAPSDLAGVRPLTTVQTTAEGRLFLYTYSQTLSDLFLVSNLR